jgi:hypothetical protein
MKWCQRPRPCYDYELMRPLSKGDVIKLGPGHYRIVHNDPVRTGLPGRPATPKPEPTPEDE